MTPTLEPLESRTLLSSVILKNKHLTVRGDNGVGNDISVALDAAKKIITVILNGTPSAFKAGDVNFVDLVGGDQADYLHVDSSQAKFPRQVRFTGMGGDDTLVGGDEKDTFFGDDGNDTIITGNGDDTVRGGAGDDTIMAGDSLKVIFGDDGNDTITTGIGRGYIFGGAGDDTISTRGAEYEILGNDGNDVLTGRGRDTLWAGSGADDVLHGGAEQHFREVPGVTRIMRLLQPTEPKFKFPV